MNIAILRNEDPSSSRKWQLACEKLNVTYQVIDLTSVDWLQQIQNGKYDFFLLRPSGLLTHFKTLYDERLYIISKILKYDTFPSYEECYIYENKKLLSYFLQANAIPHPVTKVFYHKKEALEFIENYTFPIVAKTSIGASGSGVKIIRSKKEAQKYVFTAFSGNGIKRRFGPNRVTGSPGKWVSRALNSRSYFFSKIGEYISLYKHGERDFVILQEYINHDFEWRVVRIGASYFAHKKIKVGEKASGSKGIDFVTPPESILNFTRTLCDKFNFQFMAIDLFEEGKGGYLVNELQTIFGHVQNYILSIDNNPGRYIYSNDHWIFEAGDFNTNESYDLRLKVALDLYAQKK
jgi:glutathione synthase/RimK-type ligase-like ATP-grasp enzyme